MKVCFNIEHEYWPKLVRVEVFMVLMYEKF